MTRTYHLLILLALFYACAPAHGEVRFVTWSAPFWDASFDCSTFPPADYKLNGILEVISGPPPENYSVHTFLLMPDGFWRTSVKYDKINQSTFYEIEDKKN